MLGYPYISQIFYAILKSSKVMRGRFYTCPKWGEEMNNPNIEEQLAIGQIPAGLNKYPAALLMPPSKAGNFQYGGVANVGGTALWDLYPIKLLFVTTATSTGSNQPMNEGPANKKPHTIQDTWHDMDRVAQNFCAVLDQKTKVAGNALFWDGEKPRIYPVTNLGNDSVSGVMLTFKFAVFPGCTIEDYPADWKDTIVLPAQTDVHPLHAM